MFTFLSFLKHFIIIYIVHVQISLDEFKCKKGYKYIHYPLKRGDEVDEGGVRKENGKAKNLA